MGDRVRPRDRELGSDPGWGTGPKEPSLGRWGLLMQCSREQRSDMMEIATCNSRGLHIVLIAVFCTCENGISAPAEYFLVSHSNLRNQPLLIRSLLSVNGHGVWRTARPSLRDFITKSLFRMIIGKGRFQ